MDILKNRGTGRYVQQVQKIMTNPAGYGTVRDKCYKYRPVPNQRRSSDQKSRSANWQNLIFSLKLAPQAELFRYLFYHYWKCNVQRHILGYKNPENQSSIDKFCLIFPKFLKIWECKECQECNYATANNLSTYLKFYYFPT